MTELVVGVALTSLSWTLSRNSGKLEQVIGSCDVWFHCCLFPPIGAAEHWSIQCKKDRASKEYFLQYCNFFAKIAFILPSAVFFPEIF